MIKFEDFTDLVINDNEKEFSKIINIENIDNFVINDRVLSPVLIAIDNDAYKILLFLLKN